MITLNKKYQTLVLIFTLLSIIFILYKLREPVFVFEEKNENKTNLFFYDTQINLDTIRAKEKLVINIPFENMGDKILRIDNIISECSCSVPKMKKNFYQPGAKDTLKISFFPSDTGSFEKNISVFSNNDDGVVIITLSGYIVNE